MNTPEIFLAGCQILSEVMTPNGFVFVQGAAGISCGGEFASGQFVKADRRLEVHFRYSLGLVTYHVGTLLLRHDSYREALLGRGGLNEYPGFSNDPLDGFRHLQSDLVNFCGDFLHGSDEEFECCVSKAQEQSQVTGLKALRLYGAV